MHDLPQPADPDRRPPFAQIYEAHASAIYRYCLAQVRDPAVAEDLAAQVFVSALEAYDSAPPDSAVRPWLFRIARNDIIDQRRSAARWRTLMGRMGRDQQDRIGNVENTVALNDEFRRLLNVMAGMRKRDRVLIGLRAAAGLSYAEIGELMGINEHAASAATYRAFERLRQRSSETP